MPISERSSDFHKRVAGDMTAPYRFVRRKWLWLRDRVRKRLFRAVGWRRYLRAVPDMAVPPRPRGRVFVDVTVISHEDAATGIQRVVRTVAFLLATRVSHHPPPVFVYEHRNRHYVVHLENGGYRRTLEPAEPVAGDVFFGLDFSLDALWRMRGRLREMRRRGVRFWFLIHDLLPMTRPEWFSPLTALRYFNWLAVLAAITDGFFCVSAPVARELERCLRDRFGIARPIDFVVIPVGCDLASTQPSSGGVAAIANVLAAMRGQPSILMVGTIEPRKGHDQALQAMEKLWEQGRRFNLVIAGGVGWKVEDLSARLDAHPERGKQLFVVGKVCDESLELLYQACAGVLFPSFAEGFGLPIVEALAHGKSVLARRLEVFEVHDGKGIVFFDPDAGSSALAHAIVTWMERVPDAPVVRPDLLASWNDTVEVIAEHLPV